MKKHCLIIPGILIAALFFSGPPAHAQKANAPADSPEVITVEGRLELEKHGETDWLILHSRDAATYLIQGAQTAALKKILRERTEKNLVVLMGNKSGRYNSSCRRKNVYETNEKGESVLVTGTRCYRYYFLDVTKIISSKISEELMPYPIRDSKLEVQTKSGGPDIPRPIVGEIRGTISSLNVSVKNPIKTVEITNLDAENPLKKIILILTPETRILQNVPNENPMPMISSALQVGQEVTAMYQRDEYKVEALSITINKLK